MGTPTANVLSLCTGAGGLELGLHLAVRNARLVCCVEHEASAIEVLATRMEEGRLDDAPVWTDLHTFDGRPWRGVVDIVTAGFPCQPFSVAGKRGGVEDPRHLWPDVARVIRECEPQVVFLENVPGLLTTVTPDGRFAYELVEDDLQSMGFRVASGLFTAAEVGATHRRERLFILAYTGRECDERWGISYDVHGEESGTPAPFPLRCFSLSAALGRKSDGAYSCDGRCGQLHEGEWGVPEPNEGGCASVGHSLQSGVEGCLQREGTDAQGREESHGSAWESGCVLGDTSCDRCRKDAERESGATGRARPCSLQEEGRRGEGVPIFPPGPTDTRWRSIVLSRPDLAPALSMAEEYELGLAFPLASQATQPQIRRVDDGLGSRVDLPRPARLRLTGNGVVPAQAAYAFRSLWADVLHVGA